MLKDFLKNYDTLIFDMDGVMTSEQGYWDSAALTVYEFLHSKKYFGNEEVDLKTLAQSVKAVREEIFFSDKLITALKKKGVNSNWDLAYVTLAFYFIYGSGEKEIFAAVDAMSDNVLDEYEIIGEKLSECIHKDISYTKRNGGLWIEIFECFQEWYLGSELYEKTYNKASAKSKPGLIYDEEPLGTTEDLQKLTKELAAAGKRLCVATGRVSEEIVPHLKKWDIYKYFDQNAIISFDYVQRAEKKLEGETLTKPHPYMFLKALYGSDYDDEKVVKGDYDKSKIFSTLVVGDAGADILAAQAMNADFCAVLTGVSGQEARGYFESLKSDYILDTVMNLLD